MRKKDTTFLPLPVLNLTKKAYFIYNYYKIITVTLYPTLTILYVHTHMMGFLHRSKNQCKICHERFDKHQDLIEHARKVHHQSIIRCRNCGMEFLHEEDRLHHVQEEKEKKVDRRRHR